MIPYLKLEDFAFLARVAEKCGDQKLASLYNNFWENAWEEDGALRNLERENSWWKNIKRNRDETRDKEIALREEMDEDWITERRMEYLDNESRAIQKEIWDLKKSKKITSQWFLFEDELKQKQRKHKSLYIEYVTLKKGLYGDNDFTDDMIQRCRDVLIELLLPTPIQNAGGGRKKALCPFHEEKTPSFVIYTEDNQYHCFGCGVHGRGAISFIMQYKNLNFIGAINFLKRLY